MRREFNLSRLLTLTLSVVMITSTVLNYWTYEERKKLNQRYQSQIERQDEMFQELYELEKEQYETYKTTNDAFKNKVDSFIQYLDHLEGFVDEALN